MNFMSRFLRLLLGASLLSAYHPSVAAAESEFIDNGDGTHTVIVDPPKKKKKKKRKSQGGATAKITYPVNWAIENGNYAVKLDREGLEGEGLQQAKDCRQALEELARQQGAVFISRDGDSMSALNFRNSNLRARNDAAEKVKKACEGVLPNAEDIALQMMD